MSEKKSKNANGALAPLIATVIAAVAAVAAVIVLIVVNSGEQSSEPSGSSVSADVTFHPSQELIEECNNNAHDLVAGNYEILRLFMLEGVPHEDEPYGNEPEDGYYTASSAKYPTYAALEAFVKSVFVSSEAERILHNFDGNGLTVYNAREGYGGALGIIADFAPDTSYGKPWESTRIQFVPVSETECSLTIFLGADEDTDLSTVSEELSPKATMVKTTEGWRLTKLVY
ncbi:MAG: hypothetical protein NC299_06020 [Lachnospiraceae bacterium]|nr:hypothetical protein [Ruminococcus sp.]MCM1274909.1 hypothetical protein [Lachnospiraceae bacterium]